ncbi:MAG: hypothetical protein K2L02_02340 [Clostridia bacterium]|nr:hypothetical protein [Clostridia bacterium]
MIHSLSGGVIADGQIYTFVKVEVDGAPRWFISPFPVKAGDRVLVPFNYIEEREGVVLKTENCTANTAPCSVKRTPEILKVL